MCSTTSWADLLRGRLCVCAALNLQGIWMWGRPFIRTVPGTGDDVAVFLLDTQVSSSSARSQAPVYRSSCTVYMYPRLHFTCTHVYIYVRCPDA